MIEHYCHAIDCEKEVPPRLLMCAKHWKMVPKNLQSEIWRLYRPGQDRDKNPSFEYLDAMTDCIRFVREREKPGSTILAQEHKI